ncbi:MAG: ABC transporter ATP-binding protein [Deltaproteobacteria bacterium HGW-Deltaproteobacteria-6]|nr:MAG: ABC transporter ATP-binding protein [Deltaproteobacteria bacterium HGW-Deltaproteobacteria-6]
MLNIKDLNAAYGVIPVLHDVNLEIREGELVALLGANGAGKTTLLNNISGVLPAKSGTISFLGEPIQHLSSDRIVNLGISQIPEGRKIFPYLSVKENLLMGASTKKAWKKRREMLEKVYTLFPILNERTNQRASLMSGGEQQMLVIARGLMARPKLLMIDEPSLGLSPLIMSQIYDVIKTFPDEGITVLLSEQNALYALEIANRGYVMQDGHIVLTGTSEFLLNSELVKKAYIGM